MKVVVLRQGSPEWLVWRNGGVGSSDAIVIAAHYGLVETLPWMQSIDQLYEEKVTGVSHVVVNDRMRRGTEFEPVARAKHERESNTLFQPMCGEMDIEPMVRASFDGVRLDQLGYLEIKCPDEAILELAKSGTVVPYYVPQVAHQGLALWGTPDTWPAFGEIRFYAYDPDHDVGYEVHPSTAEMAAFAAKLLACELEFIEALRKRIPPCGTEYRHLARQLVAVTRKIDALDAIRSGYRDRMVTIAEERHVGRVLVGGVSLTHSTRAGKVDWERLATENGIDAETIERYRGKGKSYWSARVAPSAEAEDVDLTPLPATESALPADVVVDPFWSELERSAIQ